MGSRVTRNPSCQFSACYDIPFANKGRVQNRQTDVRTDAINALRPALWGIINQEMQSSSSNTTG